MAEKRKFMYYDPIDGEFKQAGDNDVLGNIQGTDATSGEAFEVGDILYVEDADGKAYKADALDDNKRDAVFIALEAATAADETIQVSFAGNEIPNLAIVVLDTGVSYSLASPSEFDIVSHGLSVDDLVRVRNSSGDIADGLYKVNTVVDTDTFTIKTLADTPVDSATGGTADVDVQLLAGKKYWLDTATPGKVSASPPSGTDKWVVEVGHSTKDAALIFNPRSRIKL